MKQNTLTVCRNWVIGERRVRLQVTRCRLQGTGCKFQVSGMRRDETRKGSTKNQSCLPLPSNQKSEINIPHVREEIRNPIMINAIYPRSDAPFVAYRPLSFSNFQIPTFSHFSHFHINYLCLLLKKASDFIHHVVARCYRFCIIIPVMPVLIEELIHGDLSAASRWGGWATLLLPMQFCAHPSGHLSDRYGRRRYCCSPLVLDNYIPLPLHPLLDGCLWEGSLRALRAPVLPRRRPILQISAHRRKEPKILV